VRRQRMWLVAAVFVVAVNLTVPAHAQPTGVTVGSGSPVAAVASKTAAARTLNGMWETSMLRAAIPDSRAGPAAGPAELTVLASGDVLLHRSLWRQAAQEARSGGQRGFDFHPLFAGVRSAVSAADVAICHLETPVGNPGGPYTGYPRFTVPPQVLLALADTGYDTCSTASNHSLDDGPAGVRRTLDALDAVGLAHAGTYRSAHEHDTPTLLSVRGVPVAHLSYTFSFNGLRRPPGMPWLANQLRPNTVLEEARRARAAGAQIVVVSLHWGTEYSQRANDGQIRIAHQLLASPDVDLVLGHHAHVVQPFERIGDKWVVYGLGNHVAHQPSDATRDGVLARMTFHRVSPNRWRVVRAEALPTWMQLESPARLILVPAALADPATPAPLRAACARSLRRTTTALLSRRADTAGLLIRNARRSISTSRLTRPGYPAPSPSRVPSTHPPGSGPAPGPP
jgi:poly-gamma-glutamate capsule biosynthesis protein CapA/YwtB (metallophosphatase superfamily)